MRHGLFVAPFAELADPHLMIEVARAAEAGGWDGLFLWDHVHRDPNEVTDISDVWTMLAGIAATTDRLRLGPMVTPLSRRRLSTLIRQTTTLDHLSRGRLTMGIGLGVDGDGELTRFGEVVDARTRAAILDESADLLVEAWTGGRVTHRGTHRIVDGVAFQPRPVQRPGIPLWCAARAGALRPVRRSARFDGLFTIEVDAAQLRRAIDEVVSVRGSLEGFDVAVRVSPLDDPSLLDVPGVTWAIHSYPPDVPGETVLADASAGAPPPG
ncbi:MAG: LLM class flavin-dependent oxidoreductase [Microthrixaceae bacterium]